MNKEKIIVFGTGSFMNQRLVSIMKKFYIVFFCDNNSLKWNEEIEGIKVIDPKELQNYYWDYILIASSSRLQICRQLKDMHIEDDKILIYENWKTDIIKKKNFYPTADRSDDLPIIRNIEDTINIIIDNKASLSRFGDGEFLLMSGMPGPKFQTYNSKLVDRLRKIIKSNEKSLLIGISDIFSSLDAYTDSSIEYWEKTLYTYKYEWWGFLKKNKIYENALITRPYISYRDKSKGLNKFNSIRRIWDSRDIVIVEGEKSRLGVGNNLFCSCKSINRIICPSVDAFEVYEEILNAVSKQNKDKLILIALGPTATVLAFDLNRLGYQAIDIGHIDIEYEHFLHQYNEVRKIEGKYVNEIIDGDVVYEIKDNIYESQIIERVCNKS